MSVGVRIYPVVPWGRSPDSHDPEREGWKLNHHLKGPRHHGRTVQSSATRRTMLTYQIKVTCEGWEQSFERKQPQQ